MGEAKIAGSFPSLDFMVLGILGLGVLFHPLPFSLWKTKKAESLAALVGQGLLWELRQLLNAVESPPERRGHSGCPWRAERLTGILLAKL